MMPPMGTPAELAEKRAALEKLAKADIAELADIAKQMEALGTVTVSQRFIRTDF